MFIQVGLFLKKKKKLSWTSLHVQLQLLDFYFRSQDSATRCFDSSQSKRTSMYRAHVTQVPVPNMHKGLTCQYFSGD